MSVIAMKITKAEKHPNADRLRLYEAQALEQTVVFVANLTNVYEVDDVVAVAQIGTVLVLDGEVIKIEHATIRKVESHGMGLGKTDHPVGCNLDSLFPFPLARGDARPDPERGDVDRRVEARDNRGSAVRVSGRVLTCQNAHGMVYAIEHENDGSIGYYKPVELVVL